MSVGGTERRRARHVAVGAAIAVLATIVAPTTAGAVASIELTSFEAEPSSVVVNGADGTALEDLRTLFLPPSEGGGTATIDSSSMGRISMGRIALQDASMGRISMGRISMGRISLSSPVLDAVFLSQIALSNESFAGWDEFLDGSTLAGVPLQTISLLKILTSTDPVIAANRELLDLASLDFTGTTLASLPIASILLAAAPLSEVPVAGPGGALTTGEAAWCAALTADLAARGLSCAQLGLTDGTTANEGSLVSASLAGLPLDDDLALSRIPLEDIPDSALDDDTSPLASIPLSQGDLVSSSMGRISMGRIDLQESSMGRISMGRIDLQSSSMGRISMGRIDVRSFTELTDVALQHLDTSDGSALDGIDLATLPVTGTALAGIPLTRANLTGTPLGNTLLSKIGSTGPLGGIELAKIGPSSNLRALSLSSLDLTPFSAVTLGQLPSFGSCDEDDATTAVPTCATPLAAVAAGHTLGQLIGDLGDAGLGTTTLGQVIPSGFDVTQLGGTLAQLLAGLTYGAGEEPLPGVLGDLGLEIGDLVGTLAELLNTLPAATLSAIGLDTLAGILALVPSFDATLADLIRDLTPSILDDDEILNQLLPLLLSPIGGTLADFLGTFTGDLEELDLGTLGELLSLVTGDPIEDLGSLAELIRSLTGASGLTLADVILLLVSPADFDWEAMRLDAADLDAIRLAGARVHYTAQLTCATTCPAGQLLEVTLPTGFAYAGGLEGASAPEIDGQVLRFLVPAGGAARSIEFNATPVIGPGAVAYARLLDPAGVPLGDPGDPGDPAEVTVATGPDPGPGTPSVPRVLAPDRMYLASLDSADDIHYWKVRISSPGQRMSVFLGNLVQDYDLVLYGEEGLVKPLRGAPESRRLSLDTNPVSLDPLSDVAGTEPREDLPLLDRPPYAIAAERPADDAVSSEVIETGPLEVGDYLIQVSGYNGAFTDIPYTLRAKVKDAPELGACGPRTWSLGAALPAQPPVDSDDTTLFLINGQRLDATFGTGSAQSVLDNIDDIDAMADGPEVGVMALDSIPAVSSAYATWDAAANRCEPQKANDVVRAIGKAIDGLDAPDLDSIVVVGADDIIPFSRVRDATTLANEQEYAQTFDANSELASALARGYVLSDDPLADPNPVQSADRELFVPDLGVSRLVETPDDINGALDDFVTRGGKLDASTGFSSGYDFLTDGAKAVAEALANPGGATRTVEGQLVGDDTWTAEQLRHLLFRDPVDAPNLASLNAHFDHSRLLPGLSSAEGTQDDLVTIADVAANVEGSLLFSMGCHSGLSVATSASGTERDDWAETFIENGALWVGNTGYGYGDTDVVALSEQLMVLFARNLDGALPVGTALAQAKQQYLADLGVISPYDEKALMQTTLFGLPMYALDTPAPPASDPPAPPTLTAVPGAPALQKADVSDHDIVTTPSSTDPADPRYWSVDGRIQATQYRPIQPRMTIDVTPADDTKVARGALITDLVSQDVPNTRARIFRPVVDNGVQERIPVLGDSIFPAAIQSVSSFETFDDEQGTRQQLVLIPGQYRSIETGPASPGIQRLYSSIDSVVYYGDVDDGPLGPPATIERADGAHVGVTAAFAVETDRPQSEILRAYVLYTAPGMGGQWEGLDLGFEDGRWTGNQELPVGIRDDESAQVDYIVQLVTTDGQVSTTSNKGRFFVAPTPKQEGPILIKPGATSMGGWFRVDPLSITLEPPAGMTDVWFSVDGAVFERYTGAAFSVTGEGLHRVRARRLGDPSSESSLVVPIDTVEPFEVRAPDVDPDQNAAGWNGGPTAPQVTFFREGDQGSISSGAHRISYSATGDQPSGTQSSTTGEISKTVTVEGITSFSYWSTDRAGNENTHKSFVVKYDKTAPTIGFTPPAFASNLLATTTYGGSTKPVSVFNPVPSTTPPVPTYLLNSTVTVGYQCNDPVPASTNNSGLAVCSGGTTTSFGTGADVANGTLNLSRTASNPSFNTSTPGVKTITVTSTDVAGNTFSKVFTYRVVYKIEMLYDHTKAGKSGTTLPIKIKLRDATGVDVSSASITLTGLEFRLIGATATSPGGANPGGVFQFNASTRTYQFNAKATLAKGTYGLAFRASTDPGPSIASQRFVGPWTPYRAEFKIG